MTTNKNTDKHVTSELTGRPRERTKARRIEIKKHGDTFEQSNTQEMIRMGWSEITREDRN
jgi:hypothetical protein